jgi:hypothetical protein
MNDAVLQQLAQEIAKQTALNSWPFYLALLALSFIGATLGPFLKAHFTKRGEVSATKADADEILRQLKETTAAAKSVELSLAQGDWIQRERNTLKRLKLEQLMVAAFAIASWTSEDAKNILKGNASEDKCPIDEFKMLSMLYFPEFRDQADQVENLYRDGLLQGGQIRLEAFLLTSQVSRLSTQGQFEMRDATLATLNRLQTRRKDEVVQRSVAVHRAVQELAQAAHLLMEQLTAQPSATQ